MPLESTPSLNQQGAETRSRIIAVTVRAFAERGMDNVSLRELTALAGVNVAAINYHFGSKEGLAEAIFDELSPQVNGRRLDELEHLLRRARDAGERPAVADIVRSFIRPYLIDPAADGGLLLAQLVLKHRVAPSPMTQRIISRHFDPMALRYIDALRLACPEIDADEFPWRYMFMAGAVVLSTTDRAHGANRVAALSAGRLDAADPQGLVTALTRFLVGGLQQPAAPQAEPLAPTAKG